MNGGHSTYPEGAGVGAFTYIPMSWDLVHRLEAQPSEPVQLSVVRNIDGVELVAHTLTPEQMREHAARLLKMANEREFMVSIDAMRGGEQS